MRGARGLFLHLGGSRVVRVLGREREREAATFGIDAEDGRFHFLTLLDHFLRMVDATARTELADVHEALDARRDLDECAERLEANDLALHALALGERRDRVAPRIVAQCLEREGDALLLLALGRFDLEDDDIDALAERENVLGLRDARVAELRDVEHALDTADIDERAERLEADDLAVDDEAGNERAANLGGALLVLFFDERATRQHQVARLVARDPELEALADIRREVLDETGIDLRGRDKAASATDIDREAALDDLGHETLDREAEVRRLLELGGRLWPLAEPRAQHELPTGIRGDARLDRIADLDEELVLVIGDLRALELPFGFAAEVDEHGMFADRDDLALDRVADARALGTPRLVLLGVSEHRGEVFVVGHEGREATREPPVSARPGRGWRGLNRETPAGRPHRGGSGRAARPSGRRDRETPSDGPRCTRSRPRCARAGWSRTPPPAPPSSA